jgi:hypothetical protein
MYSNGFSNQIIKFKNRYIGNFIYMSCQFRAQKCIDFPLGNIAQLAELEHEVEQRFYPWLPFFNYRSGGSQP